MTRIKGITVLLTQKTQTGIDALKAPIYSTTQVSVENVLVGQPTSEDAATVWNLYEKRVVYTLAIPKGDTHDWTDTLVTLPAPFAGVYRTVGIPTAGIEENIPLDWNKKVQVERYEQ